MTSVPSVFTPAIAFDDHRAIARGPMDQVALAVRDWLLARPQASVLVFDAVNGKVIDLDLRGSDADIVSRLGTFRINSQDSGESTAEPESSDDSAAPRSRGRPRLGVVAREVTLLPRHWEWLANQRGGASVTLRKLVETARRVESTSEQARNAQEACWRFMSALGGDLPGFEEASRALFARQREKFVEHLQTWPVDVRTQALVLAEHAFGSA